MKKSIVLVIMVLGTLFSSSSQTNPRSWNGKDSVYTGKATWYGAALQGNLTASGERFDYNKFTAAHKFLPFGTYVKVTNLSNNRSIIVKINDRLPFTSSPIIDLTRASAEKLGFRKLGVAKVKLEVMKTPGLIPELWLDMLLRAQGSN